VFLESATFNPVEGGGSITLIDNLSTDHVLLILLANDLPTQEFQFRNKTSFNLRRFESALDALSGQIQRLSYRAKQAFRFHDLEDEEDTDSFNPQFAPRTEESGGRFFRIKDDNTGVEYGPTLEEIIDAAVMAALLAIRARDGAGGLPVGGVEGDHIELVNNGSSVDPEWVSGTFSGFSSRFNENFSALGLRDAIIKILDFGYLAPQVSLNASGNTLREKGVEVTASTLTASVTKRSNDIARIQFFLNGSPIAGADFEPPSNTGSGSTPFSWTGSFSDNVTFRVDVTDETSDAGGPSTVQASATFNFVYPYYVGAAAPSLSAAGVAGLTKLVINSTASLNRTINHDNGDVFYFAYPSSYGVLTSIVDGSNFQTITSWTLRVENITGLDGNPVEYNIYEFNNIQAAGTSVFTFIR
jgi:hypothetical protein